MTVRWILTPLLLLLLLAATALAAAPEAVRAQPNGLLELRLGFEFDATDRLVRLSHVATVDADPQQCWAEVRDLVVSHSDSATVTRGKIFSRLRAAGLPVERIRILGPAICKRSESSGAHHQRTDGPRPAAADAPRVRVIRTAPGAASAEKVSADEKLRTSTLPLRLRGRSETPTRERP